MSDHEADILETAEYDQNLAEMRDWALAHIDAYRAAMAVLLLDPRSVETLRGAPEWMAIAVRNLAVLGIHSVHHAMAEHIRNCDK